MTDNIKQQMTDLAQQLPLEAVEKMEEMLRKAFEARGVPYSVESLTACICILEFTIPTLPMMYAEYQQASLLILYRLISELEGGLIVSPIKV